jgi:NAD(P)-dependent dehydrogenase (short-subunit alcohol dehydrogenase family)
MNAQAQDDGAMVAIVTGASRGIGMACAKALARAGFRIFLVADGTEDELAAVTTACTGEHPLGASSQFAIFDLEDPKSAAEIAAAAHAAFGRVDVLVNNAGIRIRRPFGEFSPDDFDRVFAVNLRAAVLLSQAVLPIMRQAAVASSTWQASLASLPTRARPSTA